MDSAAQPEDTVVTTNDRTATETTDHEESFEYHEYHDFSSEDASAKAPLDFHILPLINCRGETLVGLVVEKGWFLSL